MSAIIYVCTCVSCRTSTVVLFAREHVEDARARFALHRAAPLELAAAPLVHRLGAGPVAAPAAHQPAAVGVAGLALAAAARGAERPHRQVLSAVVGRRLEVDEVLAARPVVAAVGGHEPGAAPVEAHLDGAVVPLLQPAARLPETRHLVPAGLQAARAGHAVTLARHAGVVRQRLRTDTATQHH